MKVSIGLFCFSHVRDTMLSCAYRSFRLVGYFCSLFQTHKIFILTATTVFFVGVGLPGPQTRSGDDGWAIHVGTSAKAQTATATHSGGSTGLYGVIEIGSKGVKGFVFDLDKAENGTGCSADEDQFLKCLDTKVLDQINVNPVEEKSIAETAKAVSDIYAILQTRYLVYPNKIYIVGSSGVGKVDHKDRLKVAVEDSISPVNGFNFVTAEQEATLGFKGVMGMIPAQWRDDRRKRTVVVDIGSGNTKGSYLEIVGKSQKFVAFEVPWGTKTFTEKVNGERGGDGFPQVASLLRDKVIVPDIRSTLDNKQGTATRDRVYLVGGIVWALSNLTHPESKLRFPQIKPDDIDTLLRRATAPDAITRLCTENPDVAKNKDIEKICSTFNINNIIAGLQVLTALSREMNFEQKKVFFMRDSLFAWPLGYVRNRVYNDNE